MATTTTKKDLATVDEVTALSDDTRVLVEIGGSIKRVKADTLTDAGSLAYGIEFDTTVSSPSCTRIGSMELHRTCPVQSLMRGCLLADDGTVEEYLPADDWTSRDRTGAAGQVMVEIPKHYRRFETDGTVRRVLLSLYPITGFDEVPLMYVSAYEAALDRTNLKLASVVNTTAQYRGGNNSSSLDSAENTQLGMPVTSLGRGTLRTYARNRKSGSTEWNCMTYNMHKTLYWLYVVEYATLNSQAAYNAELDSNGYHQGGLGTGVTTLTDALWKAFSNYCPVVPCGTTDTLGNATGTVDYTLPDSYDTGTVHTVSVPRYRGVENPFGHVWQWTDGVNIEITPDSGDAVSRVWVCDDPTKFTDSNYDGYHHVGNEARGNGYVKEVIFGAEGDIVPTVVGGGTTTYFCDYHYTSIPESSTSLRGLLFGGSAASGAGAGFASATSSPAPSYASASFGSRLCFIPA